jgi:ubiquinone/menaquinone biosynthesis C-methylase UbiE
MNNKLFLKVKDHTVSGETFELYHDESIDLIYTHPQPENLSSYYESDDYISHTDGTRSLIESVYQIVKKSALKNKVNLINSFQTKKEALLDIGAGTGDFLLAAQQNGWKVTGIEPSEKAKKKAIAKGISFVNSTANLPDKSFDIITMWHVLEHIPDLEYHIKELKRLLKPSGTLVIAVPNFNSYDANHYKEFWAAYDVPRHLWHFSQASITKLFEKEQFSLRKILPMKYDAYYVSLLSEKYKTGKMNYIKALFTGLKSNFIAKKTKEYSSHIYILKLDN